MAKHKDFTVATDVQVYFCDSEQFLSVFRLVISFSNVTPETKIFRFLTGLPFEMGGTCSTVQSEWVSEVLEQVAPIAMRGKQVSTSLTGERLQLNPPIGLRERFDNAVNAYLRPFE